MISDLLQITNFNKIIQDLTAQDLTTLNPLFLNVDNTLTPEKKIFLANQVKDLKEKLNIKNDIELIGIKDYSIISETQGPSLFTGRAGIIINSTLFNECNDTLAKFLIARELSHIKINKSILINSKTTIYRIITYLAMGALFPSSYLLTITNRYSTTLKIIKFVALFTNILFLNCRVACYNQLDNSVHSKTWSYVKTTVNNIIFNKVINLALKNLFFIKKIPYLNIIDQVSNFTFYFISKLEEEAAYRLALSILSEDDKLVLKNHFESKKTAQLNFRNDEKVSYISKLFRKFLITKNGDYIFDIFHPSLETQIKLLNSNSLT